MSLFELINFFKVNNVINNQTFGMKINPEIKVEDENYQLTVFIARKAVPLSWFKLIASP